MAGCTTTPAQLDKDPKAVPKVNLCRTYLQSTDPVFQQRITTELGRRGVNVWQCPAMVQQQDQAAAALVAVAVVGGAVAYCSNHNCGGGGGYNSSYSSYPGNCQYPWQYDAAGHRCGARSAYSRPGGY